jgi:hypothetical protein
MKGLAFLFLAGLLAACASGAEYVKSEHPREHFVTLQGKMDGGLDYAFAVYYETHSEKRACQRFLYPVGWLPSGKAFVYRPTPDNGDYRVTLPLQELRPDTVCHWAVKWVDICAMPKGGGEQQRNCTILFYLYSRSGFVPLRERTDVICRRKDRFCRSPGLEPTGQWYLAKENRAYTVDITSR